MAAETLKNKLALKDNKARIAALRAEVQRIREEFAGLGARTTANEKAWNASVKRLRDRLAIALEVAVHE